MKKLLLSALLCLATITFGLFGCTEKSAPADQHIIKVGTIAGPETELMETAKAEAKKQGLNVIIVPFSDYAMPNAALADGSIDANMFQHEPYLEATIRAKGYQIVSVGRTFIYPMGLYSTKFNNLNTFNANSTVAIPNDPSNEARALLLLVEARLIALKPGVDTTATLSDITQNPYHLKFREIDAAQLPRVLPDVDLAAINTNYAILAGLTPSKDALFLELPDSPYANILVVRIADVNDPRVKQLLEALHSKAVLDRAGVIFKNQAIKAW